MLQDWQNDTCEGKYLKSIFERKVKKNLIIVINIVHLQTLNHMVVFLDPSGMKKRHVFVMDGYLTIDFDKGRIVTTMSIHRDFN